MRRIRVIPVLLIRQDGLVKSIKFKNHKYVGDPINAVKIFNDKEVDEIIILDISASKEKNEPKFEAVADIASEAFMPLAYGGGIMKLEHIDRLLYNGAEKVILNTAAHTNPNLISEAAKKYGAQCVVVSMDVKSSWMGGQRVYTHNGSKKTKYDPVAFAKEMQERGAGELMLSSIDRDGTFGGYDLDLIKSVAHSIDIPVVACGGAASVEDFRRAVDYGASAVAAGSMFVFQQPHRAVLISYPSQEELKKKLFL